MAINVQLSWAAASGATSYDVYFGTSSPGTLIGNQAGTTYTPVVLSFSTPYYWRIDSRNSVGPTTGLVWSFTTAAPAPPAQVTTPSPISGATNAAINTQLSWASATNATSYDVYFGITTTGWSPITTSITALNYTSPTALAFSTPYYWRIDSRNSVGPTTGLVWSFTTQAPAPPAQVTTPNPANSATNIPINQQLSWAVASGAASYDVYFGTTSPGTFIANQAGTTYNPGTLANSTVYFWKINAVNANGITTGLVWSFTTQAPAPPAQVTTPSPINTAINVATNVQLSWAAASGATSYDVYFGATSPGTFIGNQAGTTYNPGALANSTSYYWRIDSRNSVGPTTGLVWSFTTVAIVPPSISGSIFYSGSKPGRIYIEVNWSSGGQTNYGTSIAAPGAYTIRGLSAGTYTLYAWRDHIGQGQKNGSNPTGTWLSQIVITTADTTGKDIALTDPAAPTPVAPTIDIVFPANNSALVGTKPAYNVNGIEIAESYKLYYGTTAATSGGVLTFAAFDDGMCFVTGLTNGNAFYCKVTALVGVVESAASAVSGPFTINAPTGSYTVSGTVTKPASTGPLIVGVYGDAGITYTYIAAPSTSQAYSIAGVANGTYQLFAVVDVNSNGIIDAGDIENAEGGAGGTITVNGANLPGQNQTLTNAFGLASIETDHRKIGASESYNVDMRVSDGSKLVVAVAVTGGPGLSGITDIRKDWDFSYWLNRNAVRPTTADTYTFTVTYADGTTANLNAAVTGVIDSFALNLAPTTTGSGVTAPTFSWAAPTPTPSFSYTYRLNMYPAIGGSTWYYPKDGAMPSTQTSVLYNVDGNAFPATLTIGTLYNWQIEVEDANGNRATQQVNYQP